MAYNRQYMLRRIDAVQKLARLYYEPGRQDRSWRWVWRCHILPIYQISFSTFEKYMSVDVGRELEKLKN